MSADPSSMAGAIVLQVVLLLINAFFAMTEIAAISINDTKLNKMAQGGDKRAITLSRLLQNPSRFLSTIQVGITLANLLGSAFAADNFASVLANGIRQAGFTAFSDSTLNTICLILITFILSYFTIVLGELVPKRLAQRYSEKIALSVAGIISATSVVMRPFVWLLTVSTNGILRLFGIDPNDNEENVTEEEIRMMVDVGGEKGTIDANEREMIDNVFEFNDKTAEELMTHRTEMTAFHLEDSDDEIYQTIIDTGMSRFPIFDEDADDIIGILIARDYLTNRLSPDPKPLRELIRPAHFVPLSIKANVLFAQMQRGKIHMVIVVDEYGGTNGLLTMEDLIEEIFGNIYDEYDRDQNQIEDLGEGKYRIEGSTDLEDVAELFGIELPEEEFDTLSGMIFGELNAIPDDGQTFNITAYGLDIQVECIEDHRVVTAIVCKSRESIAEDVNIKEEESSQPSNPKEKA